MRQSILFPLLGLAACWVEFPGAPEEPRSDSSRSETARAANPELATAFTAEAGSGRALDTRQDGAREAFAPVLPRDAFEPAASVADAKADPSPPDAFKPDVPVADAKPAPPPPDAFKPALCPDSDGDGWSSCAGDCDDGSPLAHPGQKLFFAKPVNGSFDFDCDGQAELERPLVVACTTLGGSCSGEGWKEQVPACGKQAKWPVCQFSSSKKTGVVCAPQDAPDATSKTQACR